MDFIRTRINDLLSKILSYMKRYVSRQADLAHLDACLGQTKVEERKSEDLRDEYFGDQ